MIYLTALPTCQQNTDCVTCLTKKLDTFNCTWCPSVNKCSNGVDRYRQDWLNRGCEKKQFNNESLCSHITGSDIFDDTNRTYTHDSNEFEQHISKASQLYNNRNAMAKQPVNMGVSGVVAILFLTAMVAGLVVWVMYAYKNPHTTSGQILIRVRVEIMNKGRRWKSRLTCQTWQMTVFCVIQRESDDTVPLCQIWQLTSDLFLNATFSHKFLLFKRNFVCLFFFCSTAPVSGDGAVGRRDIRRQRYTCDVIPFLVKIIPSVSWLFCPGFTIFFLCK